MSASVSQILITLEQVDRYRQSKINGQGIGQGQQDVKMRSEKPKEKISEYTLRPIVVLMTEQDEAFCTWFIRNKEKLHNLGYKVINLQCLRDLDYFMIDKTRENGEQELLKSLKIAYMGDKIDINYSKQLATQLAQWRMTVPQQHFISGIRNLIANLQSDKKWIFDQFGPISDPVPHFTPYRNAKILANLISESSDETLGGTITFISSKHYNDMWKEGTYPKEYFTLQEFLEYQNPQCANNTLYILPTKLSSPNPNQSEHSDTLKSEDELRNSSCKEVMEKLTADIRSTLPSHQFLTYDYTDDDAASKFDPLIFAALAIQALLKPPISSDKPELSKAESTQVKDSSSIKESNPFIQKVAHEATQLPAPLTPQYCASLSPTPKQESGKRKKSKKKKKQNRKFE